VKSAILASGGGDKNFFGVLEFFCPDFFSLDIQSTDSFPFVKGPDSQKNVFIDSLSSFEHEQESLPFLWKPDLNQLRGDASRSALHCIAAVGTAGDHKPVPLPYLGNYDSNQHRR